MSTDTDTTDAKAILDWLDGVRGSLEREVADEDRQAHQPLGRDLSVGQWNKAYRFIATSRRIKQAEAAQLLDCPVWKITSARSKWGRCD